jgi:hypothetical protein
LLVTAICAAVAVTSASAFGTAKGTMIYKAKGQDITTTFTHAFLIKGPDVVDQKKILRRVLLTTSDIGAKLRACETMACVDDTFRVGLQVDWDAGPRLNYWLTLNDSLVQFSGTADPKAFTAKTSSPTHVSGKLSFDLLASSGPQVDVEFDAPLVREISKIR